MFVVELPGQYATQVILSRIIEMDAENEDDAVETVRQMYRNCDIVLDASDYIETEISVKR